jgi:hypothetical protein
MGAWATELLQNSGFPVEHAKAGDEWNSKLADPERTASKWLVASMPAHGTGKNLQYFQNQFFLQWPRPATTAEQVIGRTHRNGQEADELVVLTCNSSEFDQMCFAATLVDALYIHQTTGPRQKLIYGTYVEMPKIYPSDMLRERGFENQLLVPQLQKALEERFS